MARKSQEIKEFYYEDVKQTTAAKEVLYKKLINSIFLVAILYFVVCGAIYIIEDNKYQLYFTDNGYEYSTTIIDPIPVESGTSIVYDSTYINPDVTSESDAINLIIEDSELQKKKCSNSKVSEIETRIQSNYDIVAVNLCELEYNLALEIEKVLGTIYKEFPNVSGYMSNLTLMNASSSSSPLASFKYGFLFSTANKSKKYPWVVKNMIVLNSSYYLNQDDLDLVLKNAERNNYFPKNVTSYSIVAHEFGHYLSFVAINKYYKTSEKFYIQKMNYSNYYNTIKAYNEGYLAKIIINEAYSNYAKSHPGGYNSIDNFRASISDYAMAMNAKGEYIYDETIAEAFHDYYLNGNDAAGASIEIVKVLKKYL